MAVSLDRMAVDDIATDPERIAAEIHRQLGDIDPPVPVDEIACALDIVEIRRRPLRNFEAALLTQAERDFGTVLINSNSSPQRRRYSQAHELGHFLCAWHRPAEGGFRCTVIDMTEPGGSAIHRRQEMEANRFAIELLAPKRLVRRHLRRFPDLDDVLALHTMLDISKAAAIRRYVALHPKRSLAVIFARNGTFQYIVRGDGFPWLDLRKGDRLPTLPRVARDMRTSEMVEADAEEWFGSTWPGELSVQVLPQEDEYSMILLYLAGREKDDDR